MMGVAERQRKQSRTHQSASHPVYSSLCPFTSGLYIAIVAYRLPLVGFITFAVIGN
jgi:hypothetical protein